MFTDLQKQTFLALMRTGMGENMAVLAMKVTRTALTLALAADQDFEDEFDAINESRYEECDFTIFDLAMKGVASPRLDIEGIRPKYSEKYMNHRRKFVAMKLRGRQARFDRQMKRKQIEHLFGATPKPDRPDLSVLTDEESEFFHNYYEKLLAGEDPDPEASARYLRLSQKIAAASGEKEEGNK